MQPRHLIDPFDLDSTATDILKYLLEQNTALPADQRMTFFRRDMQYTITLPDRNPHSVFCVTHDMFIRPCARPTYPGECRIEVLSNQSEPAVGEGGHAKVERIEGTLKLLADGTFAMKDHFYKNIYAKTRVVKKEIKTFPCDNQRQATINARIAARKNEYQFTHKAGHLHVKEPVFQIEDNSATNMTQLSSYMVMKQLNAIELFESITNMIKPNTTFTVDQRINLALAVLVALKEQAHDKGIIHCDIKPENIMVNMSSDNPIVYLIDYGFAKDEKWKNTEAIGSPHYMAPEVFTEGKVSKKSDIYSISCVIGLMFGADPLDVHKEVESIFKMPQHRELLMIAILKKHINYTFNRLFKAKIFSDPTFSQSQKDMIETILKKGHSLNPNSRASLEELIDVFTAVQRERLLRTPVSQILMQASESHSRMTPSPSPICQTPSSSMMRTSPAP